jgi:tRNA threonylcarbamoyladenosine biosynthesis protein TsaE
VVSHSPEETQAVGERLGRTLGPGAVVAMIGELGAGKTCFLQGLARGLDVPGSVTSPTFVLVNRYRGRLPIHHLDAYRTDSLTELLDLGLDEMLHGDGVTVIEWADKLLPLLPAHAVVVTITGLGDEPRDITIRSGAESPLPREEERPGLGGGPTRAT